MWVKVKALLRNTIAKLHIKYVLLALIILIILAVAATLTWWKQHPTPGIYLTGPTTVKVGSTYKYQLKIITPYDYKNAALYIIIPRAPSSTKKLPIRTKAYKPQIINFKAQYMTLHNVDDNSIRVSVIESATGGKHPGLLTRVFPLKILNGPNPASLINEVPNDQSYD